MIRTSIFAGLFALMAPAAWAQMDAGKSVPNLDPGSSGGTAGLISGGGTVSSNFDGRDARPTPDARKSTQRSQAKAESSAKDESTSSKARTKAARARAEADNDDSGKNERTKKAKKQQRVYDYPYIYGFGAFSSRGYSRFRDRD